MKLKVLATSFVVASCMTYSTPVLALETSVSITSDLRGGVYLAEGLYKSLKSDASDEGQDDGSVVDEGTVASTAPSGQNLSDTSEFSVRPSLHLEVSQQLFQLQKLTFGAKVEFVYASYGVRYPNGFSFQSGDRIVRFTEPSSLNLRSIDAGIGPIIRLEFTPRTSLRGEVLFVYQSVTIQSNLGSWELKDHLFGKRIDRSIWFDYLIFNNAFDGSAQTVATFGVTHRHNEPSFNIGLRVSF